MKKLYILLILCISGFVGSAQHVMTQNFMRYNPYFNSDNPAHHTPYNGYFGMPALSNLNLSVTNTSFHYKNIFKQDSEGYPVSINADRFINSLSKNNNWLNVSLNEEILGFGFRAGKAFITFSTRTRIDQYFKFSKDLITLPLKGNMAFTGDNNYANPSLNVTLDAYQEFGVGVQVAITDKLYIGIKPKFLIGLASIRTKELSAKIYTNPVDYAMRMEYDADISIISAMPFAEDELALDFDNFSVGQAFKNIGFAVDLGGVYRINDKMGVGASLLDMGFIQWKSNGKRLKSSPENAGTFYDNGDIAFSGLTANEISQLLGDEEAQDQFLDTLKHYFPLDEENFSNERVNLTMRFTAEFYYQLTEKHRFTAHFMGSIIGKKLVPQFTLAYNGKLAKFLDLCVNYSMKPNSFSNIGLGLGFDGGPIYFYLGTDNIIAAVAPLNANTINFQMGLIFKWGKIGENKLKVEEAQQGTL